MKIKNWMKYIIVFLAAIILISDISAQHIQDLSLKIDTSTFTLKKNNIRYQNQDYLYIKVSDNREICEMQVIVNDTIEKVTLSPSSSYSIIDSLYQKEGKIWTGIIRFDNLMFYKNPSLVFNLFNNGIKKEATINILPVFDTNVKYQDAITDVFQEEEKIIDIPAKNSFNIITDNIWYVTEDYDYKTSYSAGTLSITIKPHTLGYKQLTLNLKTIKPIFNNQNQITNDLPTITLRFNVKPNQLYFLNTDKTIIYTDPNFKSWEELLIDFNRNFSLNKSYRIEDSPTENGNLIAELLPISVIENKGKILCRIKPYSLHKATEGYLYIKEENRARFITNFNIWQKPSISGIYIRREGEDWMVSNNIYPGEEIEVRVEGKGLENAKIQFGGIGESVQDTMRITDEALFFRIKIPISISTKHIPVILNKKPTSFELNVREYQKPAPLDFVSINYGENNIQITNEKFNKPVFYEEKINDINLVFNPSKIDENNKLYGKQYLKVRVKIFNPKNDLVEIQDIDNIVVCPGDNSPRKLFYDYKDCRQDAISLNDYLVHQTYKLDPFTQIEIIISDNENKYGGSRYSEKIRIIITRKIHFDIQVSFPAGLLVKRFNESGYGNLTGISTSILAQFSFYDPRQIGKLKPYSIGAGFIALNAFNFSNSSSNIRDIGVVILGSVNPVRSGAKFSLPIFVGGGYLLKANTGFLVFGPGIQFNF